MTQKQEYVIEKAPKEFLEKGRGHKRINYPFDKMKVGDMFKCDIQKRGSIYNAIKYRRNYAGEMNGKKFSVKTLDKETIAVIRTK